MDWLHPTYAWALIGLPLALAAVGWARWRFQSAITQFGDQALVQRLIGEGISPSWGIAAVRVSGVALLAVALMGPRYGTEVRTIKRSGVDLVVALDVSASMRAEDVAPSRLRRAKRDVKGLLNRLGGDRVGLVLFAGDGFVQCPLTTDYNAVRLFLDIASPNLMATPGTDVRAAVRAAQQAFDAVDAPAPDTASTRRTQALLVVSDGENHVGDLGALRADMADRGWVVFAAGIGSTAGATIPVMRDGRQVGVKRQASGQPVRTRLNEDALATLADPGRFVRVGASRPDGLGSVADALNRLEGSTIAEEKVSAYRELYLWPLVAGVFLLALDGGLSLRRRSTVVTPIGVRAEESNAEGIRIPRQP